MEGKGRQRNGVWSFLQVIFGIGDSSIPFAPYCSRHHASVSAAWCSKKGADEQGDFRQLLLELHCLPNCSAVFATGDHEKKRLLQADINTQLFIALQKIQCRQVLHLFNTPQMCIFLSRKNRRYRPVFMIQALFCPEFNQFLYKQLGSMGSFMSFSFQNADQ